MTERRRKVLRIRDDDGELVFSSDHPVIVSLAAVAIGIVVVAIVFGVVLLLIATIAVLPVILLIAVVVTAIVAGYGEIRDWFRR